MHDVYVREYCFELQLQGTVMKLAIFGKTLQSKAQLRKEVVRFGFLYDEKKRDVVISYGGDGTFLRSERAYPGVPKSLFRYSKICKKCHDLPIEHALELLRKRKYHVVENLTLDAIVGTRRFVAVNDVTIRNAEPTHALRFTITVDGKRLPHEYIGDGVVVATPHGSSAYFHSITRKTFSSGIGVAFNNTTDEHAPLLLNQRKKIVVTITRGIAHVCVDNNADVLTVKKGTTIKIHAGKQKSNVVVFGKHK